MLVLYETSVDWIKQGLMFRHIGDVCDSVVLIMSLSHNVLMTYSYWLSASVVKRTIVTDRTKWQPGFDLTHHTCGLCLTVSGQVEARVVQTCTNGVSICDYGRQQTVNHIVFNQSINTESVYTETWPAL